MTTTFLIETGKELNSTIFNSTLEIYENTNNKLLSNLCLYKLNRIIDLIHGVDNACSVIEDREIELNENAKFLESYCKRHKVSYEVAQKRFDLYDECRLKRLKEFHRLSLLKY